MNVLNQTRYSYVVFADLRCSPVQTLKARDSKSFLSTKFKRKMEPAKITIRKKCISCSEGKRPNIWFSATYFVASTKNEPFLSLPLRIFDVRQPDPISRSHDDGYPRSALLVFTAEKITELATRPPYVSALPSARKSLHSPVYIVSPNGENVYLQPTPCIP